MALTDYVIMPGTDYKNACDSIRAKTGGTELITSGEMSTQIDSIQTGSDPVIAELTITENGVYTPPEGVDGYSPVRVNVEASGGADEPYTTVTVTVKRANVVVAGADVELTKGTVSLTGVTDENGVYMFKLPYSVYSVGGSGTWYVYASKDGGAVAQASPYISFSKYTSTCSLFYATVKINCETGATVTLSKDGNVQTVIAADNKATFEVLNSGDYTATVTYGEAVGSVVITVGTTIGAVYSKNLFVTKLSLEESTWDRISALSADGAPENYFSVGDTKSVYLSGQVGDFLTLDETLYVYILGFNHNAEIEGNGIHFGCFKNANGVDVALVDSKYGGTGLSSQYWFGSNSTTNYRQYTIVTKILGERYRTYGTTSSTDTITNPQENSLIAALPDDLRSVLKERNKKYASSSSIVLDNLCYIALPGAFEVFGESASYSVNTSTGVMAQTLENSGQQQYAYYADGGSTVIYKHSDPTTRCDYWLRDRASQKNSNSGSAKGTIYGSTKNLGWSTGQDSYGITPIFVV